MIPNLFDIHVPRDRPSGDVPIKGEKSEGGKASAQFLDLVSLVDAKAMPIEEQLSKETVALEMPERQVVTTLDFSNFDAEPSGEPTAQMNDLHAALTHEGDGVSTDSIAAPRAEVISDDIPKMSRIEAPESATDSGSPDDERSEAEPIANTLPQAKPEDVPEVTSAPDDALLDEEQLTVFVEKNDPVVTPYYAMMTPTADKAIVAVQPVLAQAMAREDRGADRVEMRVGVGSEGEKTLTAATPLLTSKAPDAVKIEGAVGPNVLPVGTANVVSMVEAKKDKNALTDAVSLEADFAVGSTAPLTERGVELRPVLAPQQPALVPGNALAREISQAAISAKNGSTVELFLDPVELGKLEIEFTVIDDRMSIIVRAEREDALELMRRNSDELERLLRETNVNLGTLSFTQERSQDRSGERDYQAVSIEGAADLSSADARPVQTMPMSSRLDIRI